ncbi:MAG: HD domain-containing protein [Gemmatimonadota bacterium]
MTETRLERQLRFIAEIDRLKGIERRISLIGGARLENSAEHSWHLATMASLLAEYAPDGVDVARAQLMLLIHDVVEIDAGDTFAFDAEAAEDQHEREARAAERLFGLLPDDQAQELRGCWDEFERRDTPEARFAVALDRFQGLLMNRGNGGGTWKIHGITRQQVLERMAPIREGAPRLWDVVLAVLDEVGLSR